MYVPSAKDMLSIPTKPNHLDHCRIPTYVCALTLTSRLATLCKSASGWLDSAVFPGIRLHASLRSDLRASGLVHWNVIFVPVCLSSLCLSRSGLDIFREDAVIMLQLLIIMYCS